MDDLISRQAAIDAIDIFVKADEENCTEYDIGYNDGIDFAISSLSVLPSAQPERKTGKWIQNDIAEKLGIWLCSECEQPINLVNEWGELQKLNYCPNCGAKMEEDKDEID